MSAHASSAAIPNVEREIAFDIVKKAPIAAPVVIGLSAIVWGADGAASAEGSGSPLTASPNHRVARSTCCTTCSGPATPPTTKL